MADNTKKIYFVRHGQSEGNVGPIRQSHTTTLTEHGRKQAEHIGRRAEKLYIDTLISSDMSRALETAEIIKNHISLPIITCNFFRERKRPSEQLGINKDSPESLRIDSILTNNFLTRAFRFSDEENFEDLKERVRLGLSFLEQQEGSNIMVVTHGYILRMIIAYVLFGDSLTAEQARECVASFHMENTGITVLGYGPNISENRSHPWWVWVWNDHAHLSDLA
jgi:broad specificity phosphatase PhoE